MNPIKLNQETMLESKPLQEIKENNPEEEN